MVARYKVPCLICQLDTTGSFVWPACSPRPAGAQKAKGWGVVELLISPQTIVLKFTVVRHNPYQLPTLRQPSEGAESLHLLTFSHQIPSGDRAHRKNRQPHPRPSITISKRLTNSRTRDFLALPTRRTASTRHHSLATRFLLFAELRPTTTFGFRSLPLSLVVTAPHRPLQLPAATTPHKITNTRLLPAHG